MDLKLNSSNDLDLTNGALSFVSGVQAHAQRVKMHLQTFMGETVYDRDAGVPWIQTILGSRLAPLAIKQILEPYAAALVGIDEVQLDVDFSAVARRLTVTGSVRGQQEEINFKTLDLLGLIGGA
jgi:hypothetical protein